MAKPKLVVFAPVRDLATFAEMLELLQGVADLFQVSVEVGTLARKHREELLDPGDSYLEYSVNTPGLFKFIIPEKLRPYLDVRFAQENLTLLDAKVKLLKQAGFHAAFYGNEPVYQRERLYDAFPHWRGPRIDHPRRSRNAVWSPCLLEPEVSGTYRQTVAELCRRVGILDTFLFKTNDAGSGFCWSSILYNRPNGPTSCQAQGPGPHVAAFHRAVIDGARSAGCEVETFMTNVRGDHDAALARPLLPAGAHLLPEPEEGVVDSLSGSLGGTYPVRFLVDPLAFLGQLAGLRRHEPRTILFSLSSEYQKACTELPSLDLLLQLIRAFLGKPARSRREHLALLEEVAARLYGAGAAEPMLEAWWALHEHFLLRSVWPRPNHYVMYGGLSARWLTRPLVAFPNRLTPEEEGFWLPHVFVGFGDEARRNILDLHGGRAGDLPSRSTEATVASHWFDTVDASLARAGRAFAAAAEKGVEVARLTARAIAVSRCMWKSCRHALEFGLLMEQAVPREGMWVLGEKPEGDPERLRVYRIVRDELDNSLELVGLLESGGSDVIVTAAKPEDEDTFILGPDLAGQLRKKRAVMLAHWRDFDEVFTPPHL
jgi:hypothetical protein